MMPIVCSADEVQAILEGWKTVTRLVVKPQPKKVRPGIWGWGDCEWTDDPFTFYTSGVEYFAPYQPGGILYVKEAWREKPGGGYMYKADTVDSDNRVVDKISWYPAVHMPQNAARIFLRVTDVRAERLQDGFTGPICPEVELEAAGINIEMICEKCQRPCQQCVGGDLCLVGRKSTNRTDVWKCGMLDCLRQKFAEIWDSTIKPADRDIYGWAANPFVWFLVFERISKEDAYDGTRE